MGVGVPSKFKDIEDHISHAEIFGKHSSKKLMSYGNKEAVKEGNLSF
jgi:hypothetical protein